MIEMQNGNTERYMFTIQSQDPLDELKIYRFLVEAGVIANVEYVSGNGYIIITFDKENYDLFAGKISELKKKIKGIEPANISSVVPKVLKAITSFVTVDESLQRYEASNVFQFIDSKIPSKKRRMATQYILSILAGSEAFVTYQSLRRLIYWTKNRVELHEASSIVSAKTFICPFCMREFVSLGEVHLHVALEHWERTLVCPLDGKPADGHMFSDAEHYAWAYLTLFVVNGFMINNMVEEALTSILMASIRFNKFATEMLIKAGKAHS